VESRKCKEKDLKARTARSKRLKTRAACSLQKKPQKVESGKKRQKQISDVRYQMSGRTKKQRQKKKAERLLNQCFCICRKLPAVK